MSTSNSPLRPDDFPVQVDGDKILKKDGSYCNGEDRAIAKDVADRLNAEEAKREEDEWSA